MSVLLRCALLITALAAPALSQRELDPELATREEGGAVSWYDLRRLGIEGQGWSDVAAPYDRLPARAEGVVRDAVWGLSRQSAGLCARFETDATSLHARWTLTSATLAMPHMPATGVSGLDLYARTDEGGWRWLAVGKPTGQTTSARLVQDLVPGRREYLLYLPLYNGVSSVEIGVPEGCVLARAAPRPAERARPIVFYGTSITQGGCASRPGMTHAAILGRRLERPALNLGFSGNGRMELEVAELLAELDPAIWVVDCLPNMRAAQIEERLAPLVRTLRRARAKTPILLVEDRTYAGSFLVEASRQRNRESREALRRGYEALRASDLQGLHYLRGDALLGEDGEATVDGSHPTDLGFLRQADAFQSALEPLLRRGAR